ncbi:hypothetical protein FDENT_7907 [Fusarium denticulatum]|uniref:Fungal N-terminal domain-containing protein n=1 Tax=Fusarium denticulatum TaxID=48507 RepID=A0A8H5U604_9HYPO|nr:hypothetical protein FDENT_7907 [Fusarium denticulatum]
MAELALAIIPLGITVTSGLVKYLKYFSDHDEDRTRLARQAERFESTFQSLDAVLTRSQLTPELSVSASEASVCLRECQTALKELDTLQQKIFATTTSAVSTTPIAHKKAKFKDGCKKLIYPLRKSDIETLEEALNKLSTPLTLALGMLHLDEESLTRKILNEQTVEIHRNTVISSNTSTVIEGLRHPILQIGSSLPVLQTSVDAIVPHFDQRFDQISSLMSYQQAQIKSLLDMSGPARYQDHLETNQQPSSNHSGQQGNYLTPREIEQKLRALSTRADSVSMCSCQRRRVRQSKWCALGPLQFAEEMLSNLCHEKDCDFFILPSDYENTRAIRFTGLASLLKKGIEVSFSTGVSAGRFSIGRSFTYFPLVDKKVAPAFLVMSLLDDAWRLLAIDEKRCRTLLSTAQKKLQELFCSGRASPNDVTQHNETLLHALIESLTTLSSAFQTVINGTFVPTSIHSQLNTGNDIEDCRPSTSEHSFQRREVLDYYEQNQSVARKVERLLSLYPHVLKEKSHYGDTPLHVAIYRPDALNALAKKATPNLWIPRSNGGATVLNFAIQLTHEICSSEEGLDESSCPCTLPLRIILAAGCPIIPYRDFGRRDSIFPTGGFFEASPHCKTLLAKELRSRRLQLLDLARNKLSITEISNFTPLEKVPDNNAIEIDRLLRQKGELGLGPLSTFVDEELPPQRGQGVGYYYSPIFFHLASPEDANLFVDSDFKVACTDQDHDASVERALVGLDCRERDCISLEYAVWLFDHGAPLWIWSYRFTSPMSSIFVLADILGIHECKYPSQDAANGRAEGYLSDSVLIDKCSCLCSPDGCTPFTSRMKWLAHHHNQAEDFAFRDYATRFGSHVAVYGRSLSLGHHSIMVRQATFSALKLRHTCLDRPAYGHFPDERDWMNWMDPVTELEPDEKEFEILNVDVEAINQLDEVLAMFQDFVLTGCQTAISSECDTFDLDYSAFDEPSAPGIDDLYYKRALEFWDHIWVGRMEGALDAVAKGWEDKLYGQDDLVQISTCEEAGEKTEDSEEIYGDVIFNRIVQRIQDI